MRILVCDDDLVCLKVIQRKLEAERDLHVTLAHDGKEAMQKLSSGDGFDLIITDIHMPYFSGDQVLNFIRNDQGKKTPVIMLSADGEEEVIAMAFKEGVDAFIKKPVKPDEILKAVKRFAKAK